jgi:hypothetical protein
LPQGEAPYSDSGKEMALVIPGKVIWRDIFNAPLVHIARRDMPGRDQISQPLGSVGVYLVIIGGHFRWLP